MVEFTEHRQPLVTVVVATYNRPDALAVALSSLLRQTMERWIAWVVGDCCDSRTEAVVQALADPRVRYVNLPQRCGDQSGPNSIGASLCRTPFLAFLNHDDFLLGDHLQRALAVLEQTGAEFYLGRSYQVIGFRGDGESAEPDVLRSAWGKRSLWQSYVDPSLFEPASSWVLHSDAYRRVGDWRNGFDIFRVPIGDWLLRAARARLRTAEGEAATVVKVSASGHLRPGDGRFVYDLPPTVLQIVGRTLEVCDADAGRAWLCARARRDFWILFRIDTRNWVRKVLRLAAAPIFRFVGWDLETWWWRLRGRKPGYWKRLILKERTPVAVNVGVDMEMLKHFAQQVAQSDDAR